MGSSAGSPTQIPAVDPLLPTDSRVDHGPIGLDPHRVTIACGNFADILPAADIALPVAVPSHGYGGAIGFETHCM